jgi:hypothetical protein
MRNYPKAPDQTIGITIKRMEKVTVPTYGQNAPDIPQRKRKGRDAPA